MLIASLMDSTSSPTNTLTSFRWTLSNNVGRDCQI